MRVLQGYICQITSFDDVVRLQIALKGFGNKTSHQFHQNYCIAIQKVLDFFNPSLRWRRHWPACKCATHQHLTQFRPFNQYCFKVRNAFMLTRSAHFFDVDKVHAIPLQLTLSSIQRPHHTKVFTCAPYFFLIVVYFQTCTHFFTSTLKLQKKHFLCNMSLHYQRERRFKVAIE